MNDEQWARAGRALADALMKFAHERGDAEKKVVAALQTEICQERREELRPPPPSNPAPVDPPPAPAPATPAEAVQ